MQSHSGVSASSGPSGGKESNRRNMGKKKSATGGSGRALVIVESPAKAKTIAKFLGRGFHVEASIGHVRDLPQGAKQIPAKYKGEPWANLGVDVDNGFLPIYVVPPGKSKQIKLLKDRLKGFRCPLSGDRRRPRRGRPSVGNLLELLKPKVPVHRLVFHEITKDAPSSSRSHGPRDVDEGLVKCAGNAPHYRPAVRLRGFARCCGGRCRPQALGRARAKCGGAADRAARARPDGLRLRASGGICSATFGKVTGRTRVSMRHARFRRRQEGSLRVK